MVLISFGIVVIRLVSIFLVKVDAILVSIFLVKVDAILVSIFLVKVDIILVSILGIVDIIVVGTV